MTINLATLYARVGKLMGVAKTQIDARAAITTRITTLDASYDAASRYMFTPVLNYFLSLGKTQDRSITESVSGAVKTLTEMVTSDNASIAKSVVPALRELNRQMILSSSTFPANTITQGSVTYGANNVGTGKIILHAIPSQMSASELIRVECISDTTTGSVAGSEVFRVVGAARVADITSNLYPAGSGASSSIVSSDYSGSDNFVTNGNFYNWTAGVPDGWIITTSGTGIFTQDTTVQMRGTSCLVITGGSGFSTSMVQTPSTQLLGPNKRVLIGFWIKKISGSIPLTQDVEFELLDQNGNVLTSVIAGYASLTFSYQLFTASYVSASNAPPTSLSLSANIGLGAGMEIALQGFFVFAPSQFGVNGQFLKVVANGVDWRLGDYATVQITNNYYSTVLNYTERFFAPFQNGIELPTTTGTPTIANAVVP